MSLDPNCYYSPGPPGDMYRGQSVYRNSAINCGTAVNCGTSMPASLYDSSSVSDRSAYNNQQMYNYTNFYEDNSLHSDNLQNGNKPVLLDKNQALSPQAKTNVDNLLLLSQQISLVSRETEQRPDFSCNMETRFSASIVSNQQPHQSYLPSDHQRGYLSRDTCQQQQSFLSNRQISQQPEQSYLSNSQISQQQDHSYLSNSHISQQSSYLANRQISQQQDQSYLSNSQISQQPSYLANNEISQQPQQHQSYLSGGTSQTCQQQSFYPANQTANPSQSFMDNFQQGNFETRQNVPLGNGMQAANVGGQLNLNVAPDSRLETLYRETDQLIRNRSSSMTDVIYPPVHSELTAKRSLDVLLGQELGCMRLEENATDGQMYSARRGSGTFQRSSAKGHPHFGEFGDSLRPRRRFTSLDTTAFATGSSSPLSISQQLSDDQRSQGESPLASLLLHGSSPVLMPMLDSVWTPLEQPPKSVSPPVIDLPSSGAPGSEFVPIEEFEFESDDDEICSESSSNGPAQRKSKPAPPEELTKSFPSVPKKAEPQPEKTAKAVVPDKKPKGKLAKTASTASNLQTTASNKSGTGSKQPSATKSSGQPTSRTLTSATSWSQIVRTKPAPSQSQLNPGQSKSRSSSNSPRNTPSPTLTTASGGAHPPLTKSASSGGNAAVVNHAVIEFHRGPKVDPRWPVEQQLFLGPIPVAVTWDEIRNTFYEKVDRHQILHTYLQSKPVNDVVYGQIVFDKPSLAAKILKEGPIKVSGRLISVTAMKDKMKAAERKR